MKQNDILYPLIAFFCACVVGLVLTFVGLRLYYDEQRLSTELTRSYSADDLEVLAGLASINEDTLLVNDTQPQGISFVNAGNLHIDSRFYESLVITFAIKHPNQALLLAVKYSDNERPIERPVSNNKGLVSQFLLAELTPNNEIITDVGLLTNQLLTPYRLESITFTPKRLDTKTFAYLLMDCFAINTQWEAWSINTHRSPHWVLIPPKILVLIYFIVVGLLFLGYLRFTRRPLLNAWWATLVAAWLALDAHYLIEKTVITKNTYDTFAHLSDDEKDLVLSPEAAKLAQTIKSVLPDGGKRKKIRIQFGWEEEYLNFQVENKRYLAGKLRYYLYPNMIYSQGKKIPDSLWQEGKFYYVDVRKAQHRLKYDVNRQKLSISSKKSIFAKQLLNNSELEIYYIKGYKDEELND